MRPIKNAHAILGILFFVNFLNFFDRALPAILLEPIRKEFGISDTMIGLLVTAFTLVYAVMGIPLGRLADKYPRKYVLAAGVFAWSAMTALCGVVGSFWLLFAVRVGVGIGESTCAPAANSLIASLFGTDRRGKALGIFMLGLPIGSIAAFAGVGYLAEMWGWRLPFLIAAIPGLIAVVLLLAIKEPAREVGHSIDVTRTDRSVYKTILGKRTVLWLIGSGITFNFATNAFSAFLGSFFIRFHGLGIAKSGLYSAIILGLMGLLGLLVWGVIADKLDQKFKHGRLGLAVAAFLISSPTLWLGLALAPGNGLWVVLALTIGWLLIFTYYVTVYAALQEVVPANLVATTMAIYFMFMYLLGAAFGTATTGYLSDMFASQVAAAQGLSELNDWARAVGLQKALALVVPLSIFLTALFVAGAMKPFAQERSRTNA